MNAIETKLLPRAGKILHVLCIARISGDKQDPRSLDDQVALIRNWLRQNYEGTYELKIISGIGSGERLDRKEVQQANDAIESGQFDLVIMEDLGRAFRRVHAILLCELCVDCGTRLIAINDSIDTANENWQVLAGFASMRHEMYNRDTSKRIRRSLTNRFHQGGTLQFVIYGYEKPVGAKLDTELRILPEARATYDEIFTRLENGASYSEVADWLNISGVPVGKYGRNQKKWNCSLVSRSVNNPILMGVRVRNNRVAYRDNKTGRSKTRKGRSEERIERPCPHLMIIDPERWVRVTSLLRERNAKWKRTKKFGEIDPRAGIPFKRTVWPGQHAKCGVCGRKMYWGGHGQRGHLVCSGARSYRCWNVVTCDGRLAARRIVEAVLREIESLPDFDAAFRERILISASKRRSAKAEQLKIIDRELAERERQIERVLDVLTTNDTSNALKVSFHRPLPKLWPRVGNRPCPLPPSCAGSAVRWVATAIHHHRSQDPLFPHRLPARYLL